MAEFRDSLEQSASQQGKRDFRWFYLDKAITKTAAIALSAFLLVEPLAIPLGASTSPKEKVFKKETSNSIKVDEMKKSDIMGQKFKEPAEKTKRVVVSWKADSYSKLNFVIEVKGGINLDKKTRSDYSFYEKNVDNLIFELDKMRVSANSFGVPWDLVNLLYDHGKTVFSEGELFLKLSYRDGNDDMKRQIIHSIETQSVIDISQFAGGYGWATSYYINFNPNESQLGIFYDVVKRLHSEGVNLRNVDWVAVSNMSFDGGNPFAGSDYVYKHEGKFPSDYAEKMYRLIKKNVKPSAPPYNFDKIKHPGVDPEFGATMPHPDMKSKYNKTKQGVYDRVSELAQKYPYIIYLMPDILADTMTYINRGFNNYIRTADKSKPVDAAAKQSFMKDMALANDYLVALEKCLKSIDVEIPLKLQNVVNVFDSKGEFIGFESVYGESPVAVFLNNSVKSGDIGLEPQNRKDLNTLRLNIIKAFLNSTLPSMEFKQFRLYPINNPWFTHITFENKEQIAGDLSPDEVDRLLEGKWDSLVLVPKNVIVSSHTKLEYDKYSGLLFGSVNVMFYKFELGKKDYRIISDGDENKTVVIKPGYATSFKSAAGLGKAIPSSDDFTLNLNFISPKAVEKEGWKQDKYESGIWAKGSERIEFGPGSIVNYYPSEKLLLFNIDRTKYAAFGKKIDEKGRWDGSYFISYEINPPHGREISVKVEPKQDNLYFKTGNKFSKEVYVKRNPEPTFAILPTQRTTSLFSLPTTNSDSFASIGTNFGIGSDPLMAIYTSANALNEAILNADATSEKKANLISAARNFTSLIYSSVISDVNLTPADKTFLADFKDGKTEDLNSWTDVLKKVDTGNLWKMFQGKASVQSNIQRSVSFQTTSVSLWKPIKLVGPLSFSGVVMGRMLIETKGSVTTSFSALNPDGTYSAPTISERKINKTDITSLNGLSFDLDGKINRFGSANLIFGDDIFSASFKGAADNILDQTLRNIKENKSFLEFLAAVPKGSEVKYTNYTLNETKYVNVSVESKWMKLSTLTDLLYFGSGKKLYPVIDLDLSTLFTWNKEEGFSYNDKQVTVLGTSLDFGRAQVYAKKELGGGKTTMLSLDWNLSKILGKSGSRISVYSAVRPGGEKNIGLKLHVPLFDLNKSKK